MLSPLCSNPCRVIFTSCSQHALSIWILRFLWLEPKNNRPCSALLVVDCKGKKKCLCFHRSMEAQNSRRYLLWVHSSSYILTLDNTNTYDSWLSFKALSQVLTLQRGLLLQAQLWYATSRSTDLACSASTSSSSSLALSLSWMSWTSVSTPPSLVLWFKFSSFTSAILASDLRPRSSILYSRSFSLSVRTKSPPVPSRPSILVKVCSVFCSTGLPLASTRWVRSRFSSHCPLSSYQHRWLTLTMSIIFSSEIFLGNTGNWTRGS